MDRAREQFDAAGVGLVLIGQAGPRQAARFRQRLGLHVPVLADEQRASYRAIGATVGGLGELLGPKVVAKGLVTVARSRQLQGRTVGNPAQLGGAAVIGPGDQVLWERLAGDAGDNVAPAELLAAATSTRR